MAESHRDSTLVDLHTKTELTRRTALKLLASCLGGLTTACLEPPGDAVQPYARRPAELTASAPRFFATSMVLDGFATGLVVESHQGRPTKVEGNPEHPASLGGTLPQHQASVLDLYDPQRAKIVTTRGRPASWSELAAALSGAPGPLWLVLPATSSTLEREALSRLLAAQPATRIVTVGDAPVRRRYGGAARVFGRALETRLELARADVVLALDAELFAHGPMSLRQSRDFATRRRAGHSHRLYVVEPMLSGTGALADHRLALPAGEVFATGLALAAELASRGVPVPGVPRELARGAQQALRSAEQRAFVSAVASDLVQHRGSSLIAIGDRQPEVCHALGHLLNRALDDAGLTVELSEPVLTPLAGAHESLETLAGALRAGEVGTVAIFDCNPVYAAPPELELARLLRTAPLSVHVHAYRNETSAACQWHAPLSHYLENWGDARAQDGTHSIVQPLIRPLHDTRSTVEALGLLSGDLQLGAHALLQRSLRAEGEPDASFEARWHDVLARGFLSGSAFPAIKVEPAIAPELASEMAQLLRERSPRDSIEIDLAPSPCVLDGRFASNAWLQELPHPRTKQTWGNAALLSPALARRLGASDGSVLRLARGPHAVEVPALVIPEHAEGSITLELGYGRSAVDEPIARALGANGHALTRRPFESIVQGVTVQVTARREELARTQADFSAHDRELAPLLRRSELADDARRLAHLREDEPSTLPATRSSEGPQWAMTVDTDLCTGCSACVIACQSENNVPAVGKHEVRRGREMHWLRIDTYLSTEGQGTARTVHQPMMCQHCEHAPCEYVCPVFATEHSPDGLNEMVYNRCIGTRFCQANCPYKVRRFNWLHYTSEKGTLALQRNPQVTVRDRGVMEKCTYCVQRIRRAEYQARMEKRAIGPGEVVTACQQACPTQAIQFGALQHAQSQMVRERESPRAYAVLNHLGTRPRTRYLAKLWDPHPSLEKGP